MSGGDTPGALPSAGLQLRPGEPPRSLAYQDVYHPASGALAQARHVFLAGNGLPERWRGTARFVVLETGFGLGNNFLATWQAWCDDPQRCGRLVFVSVEGHPVDAAELRAAHAGSALPARAAALCDAWPPRTAGLHRLAFDGGRVELLLAFGDIAASLPALVAEVDAVYLDGFAPARNPAMWEPRVFKAIARLGRAGTTAATWSAARAVRDGLKAAGFSVSAAAGQGGKRDITQAWLRPEAAHPGRSARARLAPDAPREALVIGAGLAGAAAAAALAEDGWTVRLLDRHATPAAEASGNPAGIFHAIVHGHDGPHARFHRAAVQALEQLLRPLDPRQPPAAEQRQGPAAAAGSGEGAPWFDLGGLLRLDTRGLPADALQAQLARLGLPPGFACARPADEAGARAGLALCHPAWEFPGGGWLRPAALVAHWIAAAGPRLQFQGGMAVASLARCDGAWRVRDAAGRELARAPLLVLANAAAARGLLPPAGQDWPLEVLRGQLSQLGPAARAAAGLPLPRRPVGGAGYVLPTPDGGLVFGATQQAGDTDPALRADDHRANLARLAALSPDYVGASALDPALLGGRAAWRASARDRLPIVGPAPAHWFGGPPPGTAPLRQLARAPGLFLLTALGSRGIAWAPLCGRIVAALAGGAPVPLASDLLDAIDPARFDVRAVRTGAPARPAPPGAGRPPATAGTDAGPGGRID
ncbi:FAD-dependent 5-carboxymethylaminomethyl-2-thiouridine(34) oxidoreductase MnmC [Piscinibacter sakaiensis]|uniref:tRNA 5-methylaminomethyl-2-thiouridine biosynthesis bifunctional protein MnmC n=1 Tax=Piscinibacter sakaiensis TaxID=1547922 RepID=A0A0K8P3B1_PISS1|nr:FAD-dependent 5-carboxymethylaminomethyl-2-thiouridine(34) oxidoreductase MnmC [Piscinibacter sakaiensis]GAP37029.1 tRNA (5-methylaminomethyl-2-thiouridylate)-methyltransferase/FAD-dependent cmnm(5)s(2)U34 oxidoreductase [Piscinibacter sakaiensis]